MSDDLVNYCGGLGVRIQKIINHMSKDHECVIYTTTPVDSYEYKGVPVKSLTKNSKFKFSGMETYIGSNLEIIKNDKFVPDVIIATDHPCIMTGVQLKYFYNCKLIIEFNLALFSYEKMYDPQKLSDANKIRSDIMRDTEHIGCAEADITVMCSQYYADVCPFPCKKMVVIPNAINIDEFEKPVEFKYPHGKVHLLYIGRFNIQKGVDLLLNMDLPPEIHVYFAGSDKGGNLCPAVMEVCKIKENFHFLGELKGAKKVGAIQKAHAVLFPSRHEPFGIVGLEAMICKTPLITTRTGGIASYTKPDTCIECTEYTIRESILKFAGLSADAVSAMTEKAYQEAKKYDWKNIYELYSKWLKLDY